MWIQRALYLVKNIKRQQSQQPATRLLVMPHMKAKASENTKDLTGSRNKDTLLAKEGSRLFWDPHIRK